MSALNSALIVAARFTAATSATTTSGDSNAINEQKSCTRCCSCTRMQPNSATRSLSLINLRVSLAADSNDGNGKRRVVLAALVNVAARARALLRHISSSSCGGPHTDTHARALPRDTQTLDTRITAEREREQNEMPAATTQMRIATT